MNLNSKKVQTGLIIASLIILALALRAVLIFIETPDLTKFVFPWYDTIIKMGRINALRSNFYNYTPAYIYIIEIFTLIPWLPKIVAIKIISIIFDLFAGAAVYQIIGLKTSRTIYKWLGFILLLFMPTVFVESGIWGQVDIIYTSFLLWSLFFILKEKPALAMLSFSIAFCFKLQAIFFFPIFIILLLHNKIKFYWFFLIPVVYFISILPCWILGRSLMDLLTIYFQQMDTYQALTMRAPNVYIFIPDNNHFNLIVWMGYLITAFLTLSYILLRWLKWKQINIETLCFDAAFFTLLIPFMLPKMHERYFFSGGIFLVIIALLFHKQILTTILVQISSLLSFIPYLTGWSDNWVMIGTIFNLLALFFFFYAGRELFFNQKLATTG